MSRADEIYNYTRQIETMMDTIRNSSDLNKDLLLRYYRQSVAEGLSKGRIYKRICTLRILSKMFWKRFDSATKEDIVQLIAKIEQKKVGTWTKLDYKKILKRFYKWLKDTETPPIEVRWIKCGNNVPSKLMKKDLLTGEEANLIITHADHIQDKALFSVLFDSGRRLGEILGLRIGDVEFDALGAKLRVEGKVGGDIARIGASQPRLALWIDNHPERDNPESPLWVTVRGDKVKQMSEASALNRLKDAAKRAGIKKRVWLYLFRHSRITPASTKLTYSEMCHVFGWSQGSRMPMFYIHLAGDDRDRAFLKLNGMEPSGNNGSEITAYVPQICPRCRTSNSPDSKFCNSCGLAFDLKYAVEADQKDDNIKDKINSLSTELAKSPEIIDKLLDALALLNNADSPEMNHRKRLEQ